MPDDFDEVRASLKRSADEFRPSLDAAGLAEAGSGRQRRRATGASLVGVGMLAIAAVLFLPALVRAPSVVPAMPAPTATSTPSGTVPSAGPGPFPVITTISTGGWKTFVSKEFPVTFRYPTNWTLDGDGCDSTGCVVFVQPPLGTATPPIELIRNGFAKEDNTGGGYVHTSQLDVLGALPDLAAWGAEQGSPQTQALVVRQPAAKGEVDDYSLGTGVTTAGLSPRLSLGESSNWPEHPERVVLFSTNADNTGGEFDKDGRATVIAILASTRPNQGFNPTLATEDADGGTAIKVYDAMDTPRLGAVTPDGTWKALKVKAANLAVRYPSTWKVVDGHGGILWITAPSGYVVDLLTTMPGDGCEPGRRATSEGLGQTTLKAGDRSLGSGPVEIRWENSGEFPVWVGLAQRSATDECFQDTLDFGGRKDVYLGSADNHANPTQKELEQAVAILASAARLT